MEQWLDEEICEVEWRGRGLGEDGRGWGLGEGMMKWRDIFDLASLHALHKSTLKQYNSG
jgi:hypothetical protein